MRTDTKTFRKRMFKDLRAAGLTSAKARSCALAIEAAAWREGFPRIADDAKAAVFFKGEHCQTVYVQTGSDMVFEAQPPLEIQPLVSTVASERQVELAVDMVEMLSSIYSAIADAAEAGTANPHRDPKVVDLNKAYDAKRDEILAINPHVHASCVDPDRYGMFSDRYKESIGVRPKHFMTYDQMCEEEMLVAQMAA